MRINGNTIDLGRVMTSPRKIFDSAETLEERTDILADLYVDAWVWRDEEAGIMEKLKQDLSAWSKEIQKTHEELREIRQRLERERAQIQRLNTVNESLRTVANLEVKHG